ncbi:hypothetical protein FPQ18DRAFT_255406, partial [Pyronema domesticum]
MNTIIYNCPESKVTNSRRKKRIGFAGDQSSNSNNASAQFIQPSKVYNRTPYVTATIQPYTTRNMTNTRTKQINPTGTKSETAKGTSRRDKLKPYVLEPPPQSLRYPKNKCADVHPWKGNHQEDHVTDAQARNGQYDKLFVGKHNNEQGSARPPIIAAMKQRQGLRHLSSLFLTILDKRQSYSLVTAPSTFKPPPRVTLPDQKREAWLRDLANSTVPLRRLSRTIPHGLKGPALLDQCVAKNIPIARAVWFVRCVGANELRGLKRKGVGSLGVGGENKWIKEWTVQVVQFIEKAITPCNTISDDQWRIRVRYATRLVTHLYAENLVDRTIFLEWYLSFLESSSLDTLPLALILIPALLEDVLKQRRCSPRLIEVLLKQTEAVLANHVDQLLIPLIRRLSVIISNILLSHRESLISSIDATKLQKLLSLADTRIYEVDQCLQNVTLRASFFQGGSKPSEADPESPISDRRKAVEYLDSIGVNFASSPVLPVTIYQRLNSLLSSDDLVSVVFEWAVTSLRSGQYRVYLAVEIFKLADADNVDIQTTILELLGQMDVHRKVKKEDVFLLISELVRTRNFKLNSYLRWLVSSGGTSGRNYYDESCPYHVQLLAEIPMRRDMDLPIRSLRNNLLLRCGFDFTHEERSIGEIKQMLLQKGIFALTTPLQIQTDRYVSLERHEEERIRNSTRAAKTDLAQWVLDGFKQLISSRPYPLSLPITQIILIRDVLELLGNAPMLLEMILAISNVDDCEILTLVANTICYNLEVFSVLHTPANDLTQRLYLKYKYIYTHQLQTSKEFLISLLDLFTLAGLDGPIKNELSNHLSTYDQRHPRTLQPIGGCSPISEPLDDDIFDDNDLENNEEIDRLWNTGAKVDKQDLSRLFETTVSKLETSFEDTDNASHLLSASKGLLKLREFNPETFDDLSRRWISRMDNYSNRLPLFRAFSSMIASSCLKIETLVNVALQIHSQYKASSISALDAGLFLTHTLSLLLCADPFSTPLSAASSYSLKLKRTLFITRSHAALLNLFRVAFQMSTESGDPVLSTQLRTLLSAPTSLDTLHLIATHNLPMLQTEVITPLLKQKQYLPSLLMLIDYLLADPEGGGEADSHVQVARLLDLADDFSIRICKLKLQIILTQEAKDAKDGKMRNRNVNPGNAPGNTAGGGNTTITGNATGGGSNTIARALLRGFTLASPERRTICKDLLSVLDHHCAAEIRQDVEELFWDEENFLRTKNLGARLEVQMGEGTGDAIARAFLAVVEAT